MSHRRIDAAPAGRRRRVPRAGVELRQPRGPSIATADAPAIASEIQRTIAPNDPRLAEWDVVSSTSKSPRGGHDFPHFWVYPLLASPGVLVTRLLGVASTYAFAWLNCGLLAIALAIARPRLGAAMSLLLFAGPILWWLDKAHSEPFSFALLAIAMLLMIERPWWALVAAGLATTQNLPIGVTIPLIVAANAIFNRPVLKDRRFLIGAAAAVALAALHPVYMLWRYGLPTLQMHATVTGAPEWAEISSTILDPTIGIIANFPALAIALVAGVAVLVARDRKAFVAPDLLVALLATLAFLPAFAKAGNLHHGGTPSLSRYAIWLIPMAMPLLRRATAVGRLTWQRGMWALAAALRVRQRFRVPSRHHRERPVPDVGGDVAVDEASDLEQPDAGDVHRAARPHRALPRAGGDPRVREDPVRGPRRHRRVARPLLSGAAPAGLRDRQRLLLREPHRSRLRVRAGARPQPRRGTAAARRGLAARGRSVRPRPLQQVGLADARAEQRVVAPADPAGARVPRVVARRARSADLRRAESRSLAPRCSCACLATRPA